MSDIRSLPKWKRCLLFFSLLICFVSVNFSLFSVTGRANSVDNATDMKYCNVGVPFDLVFSYPAIWNGNVKESDAGFGFLSSVNSYIATGDGKVFPKFYYGVESDASSTAAVSLWNLNNQSNANQTVLGYSTLRDIPFLVDNFSVSEDMYIPLSQTNSYPYGCSVVVDFGVTVSVDYSVVYNRPIVDANTGELLSVLPETFTFSLSGSSIDLVPFSPIVSGVGSNYFISASGERYAWIDSILINVDYETDDFYIYEVYFGYPTETADFVSIQQERLTDILGNYTTGVVSFDDISWTDWLVNSVGSFMNFQIVPHFTIGGLMALLIGMSLFMVFLKVFAGG